MKKINGKWKHTTEERNKISKANKGQTPWWIVKGVENPSKTIKVKMKISKANKGRLIGDKNPSKRLEVRKKISEFHKDKKKSEEHKKKISIAQTGKRYSKETNMLKGHPLEKNSNWQGGISFEPYSPEFNKKLKKQTRERDNHTCQECHFTENQLGYKLSVHHIDYNKKNFNPENLISLCRGCHAQTGFRRDDWTKYFRVKIKNNNNQKIKFDKMKDNLEGGKK